MSEPTRIAICEDTPTDSAALESCVRAHYRDGADFEIFQYTSGEALIDACEDREFDIIFLDVYMRGLTGIETARALRERGVMSQLIFTTMSADHAVEGFEVKALHYLIKPVREESVGEALRRCEAVKAAARRTCVVNADRMNIEVPLDDILYIEVRNKLCKLRTADRTITTRTAIDHLEWQLPTPPFYRCHRSYIVNIAYVSGIDQDFIMTNGETVYIRQADRKRMEEAYLGYLAETVRSRMRPI